MTQGRALFCITHWSTCYMTSVWRHAIVYIGVYLGHICEVLSGSSLPSKRVEERDDRVVRRLILMLRRGASTWEVEPVAKAQPPLEYSFGNHLYLALNCHTPTRERIWAILTSPKLCTCVWPAPGSYQWLDI
jgi:hypothetical protein